MFRVMQDHTMVARDALASAERDVRLREEQTDENPMCAAVGAGELVALIAIGHALLAIGDELRARSG